MDSFDQIELERETKELIDDYQKDFTGKELQRYDEVCESFGAKVPAEINFWRDVWDEFNREYETGIPETVLPDAIMQATGLTRSKSKQAVEVGKEFDLLVNDEPVEPIDVDLGDNETILRLVVPEERPDLYVDDPKEYADRDVWASVWEFSFADTDEQLNPDEVISGIKATTSAETTKQAHAAIAVGVMSGAISELDNGYVLAPERPNEFWLTVWESVGEEPSAKLNEKRIWRGMRYETQIGREAIKARFETAVEHNELYSPDHIDDDQYLINDPATDEGPEIIEREDIGGFDDYDDPDDPDADPEQSTDDTNDTDESTSVDTEASHSEADTDTDANEDSNGPDQDQSPPTTEATGVSENTPSTESPQSPADQSHPQDDPVDDHDHTTETASQPDTSQSQTDTDQPQSKAETDAAEDQEQKTPREKKADELKQGVIDDPPEQQRVHEAFAAAIEFFHAQIDEPINANIQWNVDNPDARHRKPETAREYFQHPRYDDTPSDSLKFIKPKGVTTADVDGFVKTISGEARKEINEYLPDEDTEPVVAKDPMGKGTDDAPMLMQPYAYQTRETRGWSPETIDDKQLGWAPGDPDVLADHLTDLGFTKQEMIATGLFYVNGESLTSHFTGRYVFPYFNTDGEPVYAISRSLDTDRESFERVDSQYKQKYTKTIKNPEYSMVDEPIYGKESIKEGQPLVITEGMADAISAHERNIPCISPVTKKFKAKHHDVLKDLILENNIPEVYIIQDADPAESHDKEVEDADSIADGLKIGQYGPGFSGAADTARYLDRVAKDEHDANTDDTDDSETTPESTATESGQAESESESDTDTTDDYAELVATAKEGTPSRAFETYIIPLPRYGGVKYDLDDYINDKLGILVPPALWAANNTLDEQANCEWVDELHSNRDFRYIEADQYQSLADGDHEGDHALPSATIQNHLPTIAPGNLPHEAGSGRGSSGPNSGSRPDADWNAGGGNSSDTNLFNITMFEVFGLSEGYRGKSPLGHFGESENYFCVIESDGAYCHKRDVWYNPATAILCLEGERPDDNPYGEFSDEEKFVLWEHVRNNHIKRVQIPTAALNYFAVREGVASADDLIEREGPYGKFEALPPAEFNQTIELLAETYDFEILREKLGNQSDEDDETNDDSRGNSSDVEYRSAPTDDTVGEASISAALGDKEAAKEYIETNKDDADEGDQGDEDDELTKFRTYEEPDLEDDDVDVDRDAVKQFVDEFAEVDPDAGKELKVHKSTIFDAFTKWAEINSVELDDLSGDVWVNNRKGNLNEVLESEYEIGKGKYKIDGNRAYAFDCISLSEIGQELIDME